MPFARQEAYLAIYDETRRQQSILQRWPVLLLSGACLKLDKNPDIDSISRPFDGAR
jgi:hypothetical protein